MFTQAEMNKLNAKAEAILMGMTQPVDSNEEAQYICDYIARVLECEVTGEEIIRLATRYAKGYQIRYINVSVVMGMRMLCLPLTETRNSELKLYHTDGVFSYVYNFDAPDCSELGYAFFDKKNRRIG